MRRKRAKKLILASVLLLIIVILLCLRLRLRRGDPEAYFCKVTADEGKDYPSLISNLTTPAGVPMILHFVYKDANILEAYRTSIESCISINSNWTVMLWTDDSVSNFISREYPQHQSAFYKFPHKIQRADAIRYLILYTFGGIYLDLDMICRQPLLTSLSDVPCFLDREREHQTQVLHNRQFSAMNSAMGCTPRHPFFQKLIQTVLTKRVTGAFKFPDTIFSTTGPGVLTEEFNKWQHSAARPRVTLLTESYFSPRVNPRSPVYSTCKSLAGSIRPKKLKLTLTESACLALQKLGYEMSDASFVTNETVAIHQFTHLGYSDQFSVGFNAWKHFPRILTFTNICFR